jgi:hypothetical protein
MIQPKFEFLSPLVATLINVNTRKELHGDEHVQAVDMSFKADFPNSILNSLISAGLCEALYWNAAAEAGQEELDGVDPILPNLRFPKLNGQRYVWGGKDKLQGYVITIEFGLGDAISNIELELCKVSGRVFETKEGGTVTLYWRVQNASDRLDMETCGKLVLLGGEQVTMKLRAPTAEQVAEIEKKMESPFINQAELDADDDTPLNPFGDDPEPLTPEQAFAASVH